MPHQSNIPAFDSDGYLPEGLHSASEPEVVFRFGASTRRRRWLALRLRQWIELSRQVGARRLAVDGSFVTAKAEPNDVDVIVLLPPDFQVKIEKGLEPALELDEMLSTRRPEEIFAAEDESDWNEWIEFFSRTGEARWSAQRTRGGRAMISNLTEYAKAEEEIRVLEERLSRLRLSHPVGSKGFTKAGIRKMIARLHEELAVFEGSEEARRPVTS